MFLKISILLFVVLICLFVVPFIIVHVNDQRRIRAVKAVKFKLGLLEQPHDRAPSIFWEVHRLMLEFDIIPAELGFRDLESVCFRAVASYQGYVDSLHDDMNELREKHSFHMHVWFHGTDREGRRMQPVSIDSITDICNRIRCNTDEVMRSSGELILFKRKVEQILNHRVSAESAD